MPVPTKGKATVIKIGTAASETDISTYVKESSFPVDVDSEDITTYGNAGYEETTTIIAKGELPFSGIWNPTIHAILAPLFNVENKSAVWGPAGSTGGNPKWSALGYLSKYDVKSDAKGIVKFDAAFKPSGTITIGTF